MKEVGTTTFKVKVKVTPAPPRQVPVEVRRVVRANWKELLQYGRPNGK